MLSHYECVWTCSRCGTAQVRGHTARLCRDQKCRGDLVRQYPQLAGERERRREDRLYRVAVAVGAGLAEHCSTTMVAASLPDLLRHVACALESGPSLRATGGQSLWPDPAGRARLALAVELVGGPRLTMAMRRLLESGGEPDRLGAGTGG